MVGSTRNSILQGTFELNFQEIVTGHVDEVWALASHPTQNQFLTAGYDNLLHLWDTLTHRAVWSSNIGVSMIFYVYCRLLFVMFPKVLMCFFRDSLFFILHELSSCDTSDLLMK